MSAPVEFAWADDALSSARVGRLATVGDDGAVHLVPFCFAVVTGLIVSAVDHKPKRTVRLQRVRDIESSGRASVLVDHYEEDWSRPTSAVERCVTCTVAGSRSTSAQ